MLDQILDLLGRSDSVQEMFGADEIAEWPSGAFGALSSAGLLQPAPPAQVLVCTGCEESCSMRVQTFPAIRDREARAFIACDKRDDVGRVPVEMSRLLQWQLAGRTLATALCGLLRLARSPQQDSSRRRWALGTLQGARHKAQVVLALDGVATLEAAGHKLPLPQVMTLSHGALAVDRDELVRCIDNPVGEPGSHRYSTSIVRRESRRQDTQQQYATWQKEARKLRRKFRGRSDRWVSQQIAKLPIADGCSAETIRKHIRG